MDRFNAGDIISFEFPEEDFQPQYTIKGPHPAVVLQGYDMPNQTVVIAPISSLYTAGGTKKDLKSYHLEILKADYPELRNDSYAKLDQLMTFSRNKLSRSHCICTLTEEDIASMHLKLIEALQMQRTISEIMNIQIESLVKNALNEYIKELVEQADN